MIHTGLRSTFSKKKFKREIEVITCMSVNIVAQAVKQLRNRLILAHKPENAS